MLDKILIKVRSNLDAEACSALNELLQNYNNEAAEIARRQPINLESQKRLLERTDVKANSCDVMAITANEGPYIAEFIHNYLHQGFSNLFIGLNNDTSGQTGPIIAAIAQQYPRCT